MNAVHITEERLHALVTASGFVPEREFKVAAQEAKRSGRTVPDVLIGSGKISEEHLLELVGERYRLPGVNLSKVEIPQATLELIPELYAKSKKVILFERDEKNGIAKLGMLDPFDYEAIEFVRAKLHAWVAPYLMSTTSLRYGLRQYKQTIGVEFNDIISHNIKDSLAVAGAEADIAKTAASIPIVSILDAIIEHAVTLGASDVHFEPLETELLVRFRIDGVMQEIVHLPHAIVPLVVARVKILTAMQIDEHRVPQDGRFRFDMDDGTDIDIRVNVMPVFHGEKVEMRLLRNSARPLTLRDLGLSQAAIVTLEDEIKKPHGMILVTGPTGHGKTTTLYAILQILNTPSINITTIEDPIEYEFPRVNQTQVNVKAGITFANGLRALLRQNPDVIMIGEIRDNETVDIAVHAALTGHLVLSSLHTNDATAALPRLLDMEAPAFLLASTVNTVVGQRLVRKICTSCIYSYAPDAALTKLIKEQVKLLGDTHIKETPKTLYKGKGCPVCGGSGYQGQIGLFEVFRVSDTVRGLVLAERPIGEIRKQAIAEGMRTMFEDGLQKAETGITTIEEVLRVVRE